MRDPSRHDAERLIWAPWTEEVVAKLNAYQRNRNWHPFTCANRPHPGNPEAVLTARPDGWTCTSCDYRQEWAHRFMIERDRP